MCVTFHVYDGRRETKIRNERLRLKDLVDTIFTFETKRVHNVGQNKQKFMLLLPYT